MSGNWAWSPQGFVNKAKGAANAAATAFENSGPGQRLNTKLNDWLNADDAAMSGQPSATPPASAGSGRNKPLVKRPQKQSGGGKPGSDDELNQFRQWQSSQSQWSGLGTGRVWRDYESLSGIGMDHDRTQYKFHDVHPRTGWGSGRAQPVNEGQGEDTRPSTVEGGNVDMAPKPVDDDWSAKEETFTPDDLPVGPYKPPVNKLPDDDGGDDW